MRSASLRFMQLF